MCKSINLFSDKNCQGLVPRQQVQQNSNRTQKKQLGTRPKKVPVMQFYQAGKSKLSKNKAAENDVTCENMDYRLLFIIILALEFSFFRVRNLFYELILFNCFQI